MIVVIFVNLMKMKTPINPSWMVKKVYFPWIPTNYAYPMVEYDPSLAAKFHDEEMKDIKKKEKYETDKLIHALDFYLAGLAT